MSANKKPASDLEFLRACYDQLGDITLSHNVQVGIVISPTVRRGVFEVRCRAVQPVPNARARVIATTVGEFPNSQNGSWTAFIWAQVNRLERAVEQATAEAERSATSG